MSQMERLYWIDTEIRKESFPYVPQVIDRFSVDRRTVFNDIRYMRDRLNAPIAFSRRRRGWYYTDKVYILPRLILTEPEVAAVRRAILAAREFGGVAGEAETLHLLAERIGDVLDLNSAGVTIESSPHLSGNALVPPDLFEACRKAVHLRQRLEMVYFGAHRGLETTRIVRPLQLHNHQGEWYLIAWCELRQDLRDFHLSRIQHWRLLEPDAAFLRPANFDPQRYVADAFGMRHGEPPVTVRIRFTPYQARWIREREYHASQELQDTTDGGVVMTLHITGTFEVKRWVLSFGAEAEVLEPDSLRIEIRDELIRLNKIYHQTP